MNKLRKRLRGEPVDSLVYSLSRINERAERIAVAIYLVTNNARVVERLSAPLIIGPNLYFDYMNCTRSLRTE